MTKVVLKAIRTNKLWLKRFMVFTLIIGALGFISRGRFHIFMGWPLSPEAGFAYGIGLILVLCPSIFEWLQQLCRRISVRMVLSIAIIIAFVGSSLISWLVFDHIPHVQDEINYFFQSKIFASGRLYVPSHMLPEFFTVRFMVNDGRWYSLFFPGWPLLLAVGQIIHAPFVINPILGIVLVYGVYRLCLVLDRSCAFAAFCALLFSVTPFFLFMAGSLMAHVSSAVFTLWSIVLSFEILGSTEPRLFKKSWGKLVVTGICLGMLTLIRPLNGGLAVIFISMLYFFYGKDPVKKVLRQRLIALVLVGISVVPFVTFQFLYNHQLTGNWRTFPQDRYFQLTEPIADCHRLGLGKDIGCPHEHSLYLSQNGFTLGRAIEVTQHRFDAFLYDLWKSPIAFIVVVLGLIWGWSARSRYWLLLGAGLMPIGYFLYYYHGNCLGARYYFEGLFAWVMLFTGGISFLVRLLRTTSPPGMPWAIPGIAGRFLLGFGLSPIFFAVVVGIPQGWRDYSGGFWDVDRDVEKTVQRMNVHEAIVLIPGDDKSYRIGFFLNEPDLSTNVIFARNHGMQNHQLQYYYPQRIFYSYLRGWEKEGSLVQLPAPTTYPDLIIEGEAKFPPISRSFGYVAVQNLAYPPFQVQNASGARQLFAASKKVGDFLEFSQYLFEDGIYKVSGQFGVAPDYGVVRLMIDGQQILDHFDGYAMKVAVQGFSANKAVPLSKGNHVIRVEVIGKNAESRNYHFGIDRLDLKLVR